MVRCMIDSMSAAKIRQDRLTRMRSKHEKVRIQDSLSQGIASMIQVNDPSHKRGIAATGLNDGERLLDRPLPRLSLPCKHAHLG